MGWLIGIALPGAHGFWAILGMAAILGGTMRAPLTGAIFALELTGDVAMLPAVVAACATAYGVTVLLMKRSILTEKIARRGQHITREYAIDPFELTRVSEVMVQAVETLSADMSDLGWDSFPSVVTVKSKKTGSTRRFMESCRDFTAKSEIMCVRYVAADKSGMKLVLYNE